MGNHPHTYIQLNFQLACSSKRRRRMRRRSKPREVAQPHELYLTPGGFPCTHTERERESRV
jgi:hypothetical protein